MYFLRPSTRQPTLVSSHLNRSGENVGGDHVELSTEDDAGDDLDQEDDVWERGAN